ncbi:hypothetical protein BLNAU_6362 [Blattamonas nauphoetae]|uniref:Uncharacterized protein n=1 Tax=Blattamonas nauphoetae TaxID=2049346 RepID=A0ABQ9Y4C1_9EUKA|nr:hypothetical protein BLNAU_6362 [Blattamonas nauphoetae]
MSSQSQHAHLAPPENENIFSGDSNQDNHLSLQQQLVRELPFNTLLEHLSFDDLVCLDDLCYDKPVEVGLEVELLEELIAERGAESVEQNGYNPFHDLFVSLGLIDEFDRALGSSPPIPSSKDINAPLYHRTQIIAACTFSHLTRSYILSKEQLGHLLDIFTNFLTDSSNYLASLPTHVQERRVEIVMFAVSSVSGSLIVPFRPSFHNVIVPFLSHPNHSVLARTLNILVSFCLFDHSIKVRLIDSFSIFSTLDSILPFSLATTPNSFLQHDPHTVLLLENTLFITHRLVHRNTIGIRALLSQRAPPPQPVFFSKVVNWALQSSPNFANHRRHALNAVLHSFWAGLLPDLVQFLQMTVESGEDPNCTQVSIIHALLTSIQLADTLFQMSQPHNEAALSQTLQCIDVLTSNLQKNQSHISLESDSHIAHTIEQSLRREMSDAGFDATITSLLQHPFKNANGTGVAFFAQHLKDWLEGKAISTDADDVKLL